MSESDVVPKNSPRHSDVDSQHSRGTWHTVFRKQLPLERETAVFILANALDVFMTHRLLHMGGFRESNPLADYFLAHWGIRGMVYFKFVLVAFVAVIAQIVYAHRPRTARWLLNGASLLTACVVLYSVRLLVVNLGLL